MTTPFNQVFQIQEVDEDVLAFSPGIKSNMDELQV